MSNKQINIFVQLRDQIAQLYDHNELQTLVFELGSGQVVSDKL